MMLGGIYPIEFRDRERLNSFYPDPRLVLDQVSQKNAAILQSRVGNGALEEQRGSRDLDLGKAEVSTRDGYQKSKFKLHGRACEAYRCQHE